MTPRENAQALVERWDFELGRQHSDLAGVVQIGLTDTVRRHMIEDIATLINDAIRRTVGDYTP